LALVLEASNAGLEMWEQSANFEEKNMENKFLSELCIIYGLQKALIRTNILIRIRSRFDLKGYIRIRTEALADPQQCRKHKKKSKSKWLIKTIFTFPARKLKWWDICQG